jgi:uncharacterized protein with HEPN domain
MIKDEKEHLSDILTEISRLEELTSKNTKDNLDDDWQTQYVLEKAIENIGESVSKLPSEFKGRYDQIPWSQIAGMRNIVIHNYTDVDLDEVWHVATKDIPELKEALLQLPEVQKLLDQDEPKAA